MINDFHPADIIGYWSHRAAHAFRSQVDAALQPLGLRWIEGIILLRLYHCQSTLVELAKQLEHAHPSVIRQIDSLEAAGFLIRETSTDDRRVKYLSLTLRGKKMAPKVAAILADINQKALTDFADREKAALFSSLRSVIRNLGHDDTPPVIPPDETRKHK